MRLFCCLRFLVFSLIVSGFPTSIALAIDRSNRFYVAEENQDLMLVFDEWSNFQSSDSLIKVVGQQLRSVQIFDSLENALDINFSGQCLQDSFLAQEELFITVSVQVALKTPVAIESVDLFENGSLVDSIPGAGKIDFVNCHVGVGQIFQYILEITTTNGLKVSRTLSVLCES